MVVVQKAVTVYETGHSSLVPRFHKPGPTIIMRRPDSARDQMRNTTALPASSSSRTPSAPLQTTTTVTSPTAPRSAQPYPHHSPTTPFRSPTEHLPYGQHQQQTDYYALPPPHQQQQQRAQYADPSGPHSPHAQYSPSDRRPPPDAIWGPPQQPPPPSSQQRYPSLRGDHLLDTNPPGPEVQKRTSVLIALSGTSSQPMPPAQSQYFMQSPHSEEPGRIIYRGGDVGVMPQFPTGAQAGPTYGSSFPHYMSSMAPPPLNTRGLHNTPPKPASPSKPGEERESKRSPPTPPQQPSTKRSKTDSTDDAGQWYQSDASPTDSDTKRAMAGMTSTVKTRPVSLLTQEQKKANHIHSEQKRRATIRKGYEALCEVVPSLREVVAAGGPGVGALTTKVPGMSPTDSEKKRGGKGKGKGSRDDDDGGLGGVVKSEALVLTKTIEHVEALLAERNKLLTEHAHLAAALPPHERPPPYVPGQSTSLQPGARELRAWETPWHGGSGLPPAHMRDAMSWMKGLPGDEDDDDEDGDDD
ncbi:hypothetical protein CALVIDRAFT_531017 [Calocera viscosa TUFC12733]|uniref:BHLH domain-containing protein n=1 Tax=Calocera viscosa (strain TUFC12733) TaxID=1330018 RepID=A0A167H0K6_CALVF|nr:hypothetical protein CALVIDRAFT_531017 [Calocera viscosa TUFC12733]